MQLAWEYARLPHTPGYFKIWLPAADMSAERASYFAGENNPSQQENMGNYWLERSKMAPPSSADWDLAWSKAGWHYRKAFSLAAPGEKKRMLNRIAAFVRFVYPMRTLPPHPHLFLR